ncbi:hypothetical protein SISNIDRAFT_475047 [Sistotremastrum niveocremeum HHB9708]|uniref:DUF6570 domain-containing protein n=1 Tax=Sistotremastrum niveocremeum HHB9708 TaxID=1314777 RepID=A0A164SGY5_9AGAM|nr:hypothetical protein SISNIDRAFT_475047 [Sistotremastrum niveocremeum HHB9708]
MIARCRAKSWIIHLKEEEKSSRRPPTQRGFKGNIIVFPQRPEKLLDVLPPSIHDIVTPICVIFVGSSAPTKEWLKNKAAPLVARREKVRAALVWLKDNNPLYRHIHIDHGTLDTLDEQHVFDYNIECRPISSIDSDVLQSRYDSNLPPVETESERESAFERVTITDVDGRASISDLRAAALKHMKVKGGAFIQIPHERYAANEFFNPDLFPMLYPTLFPYGSGGFEDQNRAANVSFARQWFDVMTKKNVQSCG